MKQLIMVAATALVVTACGGGGDDAPADPAAEVPAEASQSSAGLVAYLRRLVAADAEAREPVPVDGFAPQRPDDSEPEAL